MSTLRRFVQLRSIAPLLILAGTTIACTAQPGDDAEGSEGAATEAKAYDPVNDLDVSLGEKLWDNEQNDIKATSEIIQTFIKRRAREGRADVDGKKGRFLRDAHAKRHGCVKGELTVREDIPEDFKVGVFAKGQTYKTWQRYSNGNSEIRSDWKTDARGMAIKLTNVPGEKLVPEYPEQSTQDFVMINHPVFFVDNPVKYAQTLAIFHSGLGFGLETVGQALSLRKLCSKDEAGGGILPLCDTAKLALAVNGTHIKNPVKEPYWSMASFRLGHKAVKFAAIPVACGGASAFPSDLAGQQKFLADSQKKNEAPLLPIPLPDRDSLRDAMVKTLQTDKQDACFLFVLQRFIDQDKTPTEKATVNWDLVAPMIAVADLHIPAQTFTNEKQDTGQDQFCDDMAFTPWHALPEHKPLGVVNRTRFVVYSATAKLRREGNYPGAEPPKGTALTGPTGDESF
jgi:Catalase